MSVANVENAHHSTQLLAQTTLRTILGTKNLHEILSDRRVSSHVARGTWRVTRGRWHVTRHTSHVAVTSSGHVTHCRESISGSMAGSLDEATTRWGIKVERVEM